MPRPELELGEEWEKQVEKRALEKITERLKKEPLTENEIWTEVVGALGAEKGVAVTARRLRQLYNLRFKRKITKSTANLAVVANLKNVAVNVKEKLKKQGFKKTKRVIQFGKNYHGYIYYLDESSMIAKAEELILSSDSTAAYVLRKVNEKGFVYESELPFQRRLLDLSASLLEEFNLAKKAKSNGQYIIHKVGFNPENAKLESEKEIAIESVWNGRGWVVHKNFSAGTWVLGPKGPMVKKIKFDLMGFDPESRQLHIATMSKKRIGKGELEKLRMRVLEWGLPATLHGVAPGFTPGAEKYALSWGIRLESLAE